MSEPWRPSAMTWTPRCQGDLLVTEHPEDHTWHRLEYDPPRPGLPWWWWWMVGFAALAIGCGLSGWGAW